jgi:hypothetical protein
MRTAVTLVLGLAVLFAGGCRSLPAAAPPAAPAGPAAPATFQDALRAALARLDPRPREDPLQVLIHNVNYADTATAGPVVRYLRDQLSIAVAARGLWSEVAGTPEVMEALLADPARRTKVLTRPDAYLAGRYYDRGNRIELVLTLTAFDSDKRLGATSVMAARSWLPNAALRPANYGAALPWTESVLDAPQGDLRLSAVVDRGSGGVYRVGEALALRLRANRTCYVKIYEHGTSGRTQVLLPCPDWADNRLPAGREWKIPFTVMPPAGTQVVKVIAQAQQFGDYAATAGTRGLRVRGKPGAIVARDLQPRAAAAEATIVINIVK